MLTYVDRFADLRQQRAGILSDNPASAINEDSFGPSLTGICGKPSPRMFVYQLVTSLFVAEGSTDSGAELCVFGDMEMYAVELLQHGVDILALGQQRQVADEHEVLDAGVEGRENGG